MTLPKVPLNKEVNILYKCVCVYIYINIVICVWLPYLFVSFRICIFVDVFTFLYIIFKCSNWMNPVKREYGHFCEAELLSIASWNNGYIYLLQRHASISSDFSVSSFRAVQTMIHSFCVIIAVHFLSILLFINSDYFWCTQQNRNNMNTVFSLITFKKHVFFNQYS